jgi:hypothetical protein
MLGHLCRVRALGIVSAVLPSSFLVIKSFSVVAELELSISNARSLEPEHRLAEVIGQMVRPAQKDGEAIA